MAVKAKADITISFLVDIDKTVRYYLLQSATATAPSKPTANPPGGSWKTTEPSYTAGATNSLYFVDLTVFSNDTWKYSDVSKSSSYEAAKEAWNKASEAAKTATNYVKYDSENGLVVGNLTAGTLGRNVQITKDVLNIRNGSTILAQYGDKTIYLGKNSQDAVIDMCDGSARMTSSLENNIRSFDIGSGNNFSVYSSYADEENITSTAYLHLNSNGYDGDIYGNDHWDIGGRSDNGLTQISGEGGVIWAYAQGKKEAQVYIDGINGCVRITADAVKTEGAVEAGSVKAEEITTTKGTSLDALVTPTEYTYTRGTVTITVWESPIAIRIKMTGKTSAAWGTKSGYVQTGSVMATDMTAVVKKVAVTSSHIATLRVNASSGKIEVGYSKNGTTAENIPEDTAIMLDETIMKNG